MMAMRAVSDPAYRHLRKRQHFTIRFDPMFLDMDSVGEKYFESSQQNVDCRKQSDCFVKNNKKIPLHENINSGILDIHRQRYELFRTSPVSTARVIAVQFPEVLGIASQFQQGRQSSTLFSVWQKNFSLGELVRLGTRRSWLHEQSRICVCWFRRQISLLVAGVSLR